MMFICVYIRGVSPGNTDSREYNLNQQQHANNTALVADSEDRLRHLVEEFRRVCRRRKLKTSGSKGESV